MKRKRRGERESYVMMFTVLMIMFEYIGEDVVNVDGVHNILMMFVDV